MLLVASPGRGSGTGLSPWGVQVRAHACGAFVHACGTLANTLVHDADTRQSPRNHSR